MILIKPSFEILDPDFDIRSEGLWMIQRIEQAGRVCYKSEEKGTPGSANKFVAGLIKSGHESVIEHEKVTVKIICDRGISHEIVRHRLASYSQESTRYCDYSGGVTFVIPPWVDFEPGEYDYAKGIFNKDDIWFNTMTYAEESYKALIAYGWSPQQARSVLPNSLKTEIVMTCNLREWRLFFKLRTSTKAHPQMREIAIPMLVKFKELIPVIFDDIETPQV